MVKVTASEVAASGVLLVILLVCSLFVALMLLAAFHQVRDPFLRWWCRRFDHDFRKDSRGDPVITAFAVCRRCGKWERLVLREQMERR